LEDQLVNITIIDRSGTAHPMQIPVDMGLSVMEICKANELGVLGTCGGIALCASCHVYVESDTNLNEPSEDEDIMIDQVNHYRFNSRLGCQIRPDCNMDGLIVRIAPE
jgi:2Fe-2S ferredoxin